MRSPSRRRRSAKLAALPANISFFASNVSWIP
jgi:hypothetical protein